MSEAPDREDKTEAPSQRKMDEAIEKGETPLSRDAIQGAGLVGVWASLAFAAPAILPSAARELAGVFEAAGKMRLRSGEDAATLLLGLLALFAIPVLVLIAPVVVAQLATAIGQSPPRIAPARIAPKWSRVSPAAGWSRLFGAKAAKHAGLLTLRLSAALLALAYVGSQAVEPTLEALRRAPELLPALAASQGARAVFALAAIGVAAGAADFVIGRFNWAADLRMTKQEAKDEARHSEGDPHVRQRLKGLRLRRARSNMLTAVPRATMVVANPTHYAVALRYVRGETPAPLVLAKGVDHMALTIRKRAEAAGVPVIEDRALARSLHAQAVVDRLIPAEFYPAVAALVHTLAEKSRKRAIPRISPQIGASA